MGIPVIADFSRLTGGSRRFLFFIVFNVVSWQCIVGPAMILFARSLDIQPSLVGFLISFMPLSMLLVGLTVPLVNHYGPKRVMLTGWLLRNLLAGAVFLIPLVRGWGLHYAQFVLVASILAFCILRAMGAGGWLPWLHELVPVDQRGAYFSMEAAITQLTSVAVALVQAVLLTGPADDWRFLMVYGIGIAAGLASLVWMALIPGGGPTRATAAPEVSYVGYRAAFRDHAFMAFVVTAAFGYSALTWLLGSALVLYMRDALTLTPAVIMSITAAGSMGIFLTIASWGRFADYAGSAAAMFWSMLGHAVCALLCMALVPGAAWTKVALWSVFVVASVFNAAFNVAANRAMLGYICAQRRVVYSNIWSIGTSLAIGITPIAAGYLIDHLHGVGFYACFSLAALFSVACGFLSRVFVREANRGAAAAPIAQAEPATALNQPAGAAPSAADATRLAS
ncbi:MAG: MFS transporter [Candidatus Hydrogenedentes bacterium]|nr:MFS transporter [Candidatus Hydrogenedentota bacterium]